MKTVLGLANGLTWPQLYESVEFELKIFQTAAILEVSFVEIEKLLKKLSYSGHSRNCRTCSFTSWNYRNASNISRRPCLANPPLVLNSELEFFILNLNKLNQFLGSLQYRSSTSSCCLVRNRGHPVLVLCTQRIETTNPIFPSLPQVF